MQNDLYRSAEPADNVQAEPYIQLKESGRGRFSFYVILKYLAIFAAVFFTAIVQTGFFLDFRPLGVSPDLCLALVVAVSLRWGAKKGAIVGIMAGFCLDAFSEVGFSLLIPFCFLLGVVIGLFSEDKNTKGFPFFAASMSLSAVLRVLLVFFELCLSAPSFSASGALVRILLPNLLITLIFSPLLYLAVLAVDKIFGKNDKTTRR